MTARCKNPPVDTKPENFQAIISDMGLHVVSYLNESIECNDGTRRWLPRDIIGRDGKSLIIYRVGDLNYSIDGWEPWHDGMFGGRRRSIESALHWVFVAKEVRAGRRKDFLGA